MRIPDKEKKKRWNKKWYSNHKKEQNERCKNYYLSHREDVLLKDKHRHLKNPEKYLKYRKEHRDSILKYNHSYNGRFAMWKHKAKLRKLKWGLSLTFIKKLPLICHYTSRKLTFAAHKDNTISLDRIDNTKGYVEGYVVLCCADINMMKNTLSLKKFVTLCGEVTSTFNRKKLG
jgi:hypothetical protein